MCKICESPQRQAIEADMAGGVPERAIAARFGVNRNAVQKHRRKCMATSHTAPTTARRVAALRDRIRTLLKREKAADKAGDYDAANRCGEQIDSTQRQIDVLLSPPTPKPASDEPLRLVVRNEDNLSLGHEYLDADALFQRVTGDLSYLFAHHYGIEQGMVSNKPNQNEGFFWPWLVAAVRKQWPDFWRLFNEETKRKDSKLLSGGDADNEGQGGDEGTDGQARGNDGA